jgi:hypothetical protein
VATVLNHPEGRVIVEETPAGRREVKVEPEDSSLFIPRRSCETSYPDELIEALLELKGISHLCDEIARDEDPVYVSNFLRHAILGYVAESEFAGKRVLDFGSASGRGRWSSRGCCRPPTASGSSCERTWSASPACARGSTVPTT